MMLYIARKKHPNLKLRLGEFLKLPFDRGSFDRIVTTYAFHHLTDIEKEFALKEMLRVLKCHGEIIIGDMMFQITPGKSSFWTHCPKGKRKLSTMSTTRILRSLEKALRNMASGTRWKK